VRDANAVLPTVARTLGAQAELASHIGERELLLVLDNLEQVIDAAPELAALVESCPNLHLLVTARELLRVRGEVEHEVLPLADPDAAELFCLRAGLDPGAAIDELCRRLDNMPLALELAAARTKALTPEQILERLDERLDLFKGGRDAEARQATLRATIGWSHDLLSPEERQLFARLGVFSGGCTLAAAEAVAGADLDTLQSLVEKSLLRHTDGRFWMLETIREYALERLEEREDGGALRQAYAEFFLAVAESAGLSVESLYAGRLERRELVLTETANLRAGLDWAPEHDPELGLRLAVALEQFWVTNDPDEAVRRLDVMLARAEDPPAALRGSALRVLSGMAHTSWQLERALAAGEEALELYRSAGDKAGETLMLFRLGTTYLDTGEVARARPLLEESLAGFRREGNRVGECEAAGNLASLEAMHGDPELAQELLEQNVELARELGWRWWEAGKLWHLAEHALGRGNIDEGEKCATEAVGIDRELANRRVMVFRLAIVAWLRRSAAMRDAQECSGARSRRRSTGCRARRGRASGRCTSPGSSLLLGLTSNRRVRRASNSRSTRLWNTPSREESRLQSRLER
jgi:predicted ATPase